MKRIEVHIPAQTIAYALTDEEYDYFYNMDVSLFDHIMARDYIPNALEQAKVHPIWGATLEDNDEVQD